MPDLPSQPLTAVQICYEYQVLLSVELLTECLGSVVQCACDLVAMQVKDLTKSLLEPELESFVDCLVVSRSWLASNADGAVGVCFYEWSSVGKVECDSVF